MTDWYRPTSQERSLIGQKKLEELQKQILLMESQMKENSNLMNKLDRIQSIENDKREIDDKVLERNSRGNTPRLLRSEMDRLIGRESGNLNDRNRSPALDKNVIETVIQQRTKEFSQKQQEAALKAKYLDKERQRLQEARRRVEEQRQALLNTTSPSGKPPYFFHKHFLPHEQSKVLNESAEKFRRGSGSPSIDQVKVGPKWQLKVKFLPVPLEEADVWTRYQQQMKAEEGDQFDEALRSFQSLTSNKLRDQKRRRHKYVPVYLPEDELTTRSFDGNTGSTRDRYYKMEDCLTGSLSPLSFIAQHKTDLVPVNSGHSNIVQGSSQFTHRDPTVNNDRQRSNWLSNTQVNTSYNNQYYKNIHPSYDTDHKRNVKVRFRPTPIFGNIFMP